MMIFPICWNKILGEVLSFYFWARGGMGGGLYLLEVFCVKDEY